MKRASALIPTVVLAATLSLITAAPAAGLSCEEPQPFDMVGAIQNSDAAAVGTVLAVVEVNRDEWEDGNLVLVVRVDAVYKGSMPARIFLHRPVSVWGPYYDNGYELALLERDGFVDDGRNSLCGPFYSNEELEAVGGDPTAPARRTWADGIRDLMRLAATIASIDA